MGYWLMGIGLSVVVIGKEESKASLMKVGREPVLYLFRILFSGSRYLADVKWNGVASGYG